jgi:ATP-dependent DNA helicase RecG
VDTHKIHKLIEQGEGISVEFKRGKNELPSNLFETICALLNRNGGNILIGINDEKTIEGINPEKIETFCKISQT